KWMKLAAASAAGLRSNKRRSEGSARADTPQTFAAGLVPWRLLSFVQFEILLAFRLVRSDQSCSRRPPDGTKQEASQELQRICDPAATRHRVGPGDADCRGRGRPPRAGR